MIISASSITRRRNCPGSSVLPRAENFSEWADGGTDEHAELARQTMAGTLPEELARHVPLNPRVEVTLAYDVETRKARILGENVGRSYGDARENEIVGTVDVIAVVERADGGRTAVVIDWKTGHNDVESAVSNSQLHFYALAAAAVLGCDEAEVRIVYTKRGGQCDWYAIDEQELDSFGLEMRHLVRRVADAEKAYSPGSPVETNEGAWCKHCAAKWRCPSKNAALVAVASGGIAVGDVGMTPELAAEAARRVLVAEQLVKDAKARLEAWVTENGPIDLGDGTAFMRAQREGKRTIDAAVAVAVIREAVGEKAEEFEAIAVERKVTQAAMKRAVEKLFGASGADKRVKQFVAVMEERGGVKRGVEQPIGVFPIGKHRAAEPIDITEVDRMLKEAG